MGNHGKVRVSQNPEPLRGTKLSLSIKAWKKMMKDVTREAIKAIKIVRESEKKQGIIGYTIFNVEKHGYVKFEGKASTEAIKYTENFKNAHVFKSRVDALPIMIKMGRKFELKPIIKTAF